MCAAVLVVGIVCAIVIPIAVRNGKKDDHVHTYAEAWSYDGSAHWHAATCEHADLKADEAPHSFDNGVLTEATLEAGGYTTYTCTVCGYSYETDFTDPRPMTREEQEEAITAILSGFSLKKSAEAMRLPAEDAEAITGAADDFGDFVRRLLSEDVLAGLTVREGKRVTKEEGGEKVEEYARIVLGAFEIRFAPHEICVHSDLEAKGEKILPSDLHIIEKDGDLYAGFGNYPIPEKPDPDPDPEADGEKEPEFIYLGNLDELLNNFKGLFAAPAEGGEDDEEAPSAARVLLGQAAAGLGIPDPVLAIFDAVVSYELPEIEPGDIVYDNGNIRLTLEYLNKAVDGLFAALPDEIKTKEFTQIKTIVKGVLPSINPKISFVVNVHGIDGVRIALNVDGDALAMLEDLGLRSLALDMSYIGFSSFESCALSAQADIDAAILDGESKKDKEKESEEEQAAEPLCYGFSIELRSDANGGAFSFEIDPPEDRINRVSAVAEWTAGERASLNFDSVIRIKDKAKAEDKEKEEKEEEEGGEKLPEAPEDVVIKLRTTRLSAEFTPASAEIGFRFRSDDAKDVDLDFDLSWTKKDKMSFSFVEEGYDVAERFGQSSVEERVETFKLTGELTFVGNQATLAVLAGLSYPEADEIKQVPLVAIGAERTKSEESYDFNLTLNLIADKLVVGLEASLNRNEPSYLQLQAASEELSELCGGKPEIFFEISRSENGLWSVAFNIFEKETDRGEQDEDPTLIYVENVSFSLENLDLAGLFGLNNDVRATAVLTRTNSGFFYVDAKDKTVVIPQESYTSEMSKRIEECVGFNSKFDFVLDKQFSGEKNKTLDFEAVMSYVGDSGEEENPVWDPYSGYYYSFFYDAEPAAFENRLPEEVLQTLEHDAENSGAIVRFLPSLVVMLLEGFSS